MVRKSDFLWEKKKRETRVTCFVWSLVVGPTPHAHIGGCVGSYRGFAFRTKCPMRTGAKEPWPGPTQPRSPLVSLHSRIVSPTGEAANLGMEWEGEEGGRGHPSQGYASPISHCPERTPRTALKSLTTRVHVVFGVVACFYLLFRLGVWYYLCHFGSTNSMKSNKLKSQCVCVCVPPHRNKGTQAWETAFD